MKTRSFAYVLVAAICISVVACQPDTMPPGEAGATHPVIDVPASATLLPLRP